MKRQMKTAYYYNLFETNKNNTKKFWKILNKTLGKLNDKSSFTQNFKLNNKKFVNEREISYGLNSTFCHGTQNTET